MGLSLAKHGAITFKDGKVQQGNFDDFPLVRIDASPGVPTSTSPPAPTRRRAVSANRVCRRSRRR